MKKPLKYDLRGVSASKDEVHEAIKDLDKGLYPLAFCKVLPDLVGGDAAYCNIMHADTAGTKTSLAYLYWKETGNLDVWKGIAQDAIVMNLDDMACVGCIDQIVLSSTIGRNKNIISGAVISEVIKGCTDFIQRMADEGIHIELAGGETADVGDVVRTIDVGYTTFARLPKEKLVVNDIQAGQVIIGVASYGQASYETSYNSGIGSNGLTSARHDVLSKYYKKEMPDSFDPNTPDEVLYCGQRRLTDEVTFDDTTYQVGQLLLSPTRTYLPVLKALLDTHHSDIKGLIHCTGGAQTKVKKFIRNVHVVKNNLLPTPPVFQLIQAETNTPWEEMYQVFNMGHRLEIYTSPEAAPAILERIRSFNLEAQIIGHVEEAEAPAVTVDSTYGRFEY